MPDYYYDEGPQYVANCGSLDRVRLRHVLLYLAFDGTSREHRPKQISRGISAETGGAREASGNTGHSASSTEDWPISRTRQADVRAFRPMSMMEAAVAKILLLQGANLAYLGRREPEIYGSTTPADLNAMLQGHAHDHGYHLEIFYTNIE